jgi:hypothetical protein
MPLPQINERLKEVPAQALRAVFAGIGQVLLVADKIRSRAVEQVSGATALTTPPREAPATEPAAKPAPEPAAGPTAKPTTEPTEAAGKPTTGPAGKPTTGPAEPGSARWRALDKTGNVRLIAQSDEAAAPSAPQTPDVAAPAAKAPPADEAPADAADAPVDLAPADAGLADEAPADEALAGVALADEALAEVAPLEVAPAPADEFPAASLPAATDVQPAAAAAPAAPEAPAAAEPGGLPLSNYDALSIASLRARLRVLSAAQVTTLLEYETVTQGRPAVITMFERRLAKLAQEDG